MILNMVDTLMFMNMITQTCFSYLIAQHCCWCDYINMFYNTITQNMFFVDCECTHMLLIAHTCFYYTIMFWMWLHKHVSEGDHTNMFLRMVAHPCVCIWMGKHVFLICLHKHVFAVVTQTCCWIWLHKHVFGNTWQASSTWRKNQEREYIYIVWCMWSMHSITWQTMCEQWLLWSHTYITALQVLSFLCTQALYWMHGMHQLRCMSASG